MECGNLKEYEFVRAEMLTVKDCITKYVGFALAGSAAAIYGMARIISYNREGLALAVIPSALSLIISFVLLILFYKFYSHNRFAGYCKMLTHEKHHKPPVSATGPTPSPASVSPETARFLYWEIAVEKDRLSGIRGKEEAFISVVDKVSIFGIDKEKLKKLLRQYLGSDPKIDKSRFLKGAKILLFAIVGRTEARSWAYPPLIVSLFFFISSGFLGVGWYQIYKGNQLSSPDFSPSLLILISITVAQFLLWAHFIGKLHSLMNGSETLSAFFWKFIPARALFLNGYGITPEYIETNDLLSDMV
jgi:hypothetical protein